MLSVKKWIIALIEGAFPEGKPEKRSEGGMPARGFALRSRVAPGSRSSGTTTGLRGARWTGTGRERRKASAPRKQMSCAHCARSSAWRAAAPKHRQVATLVGVARTSDGCAFRRSASIFQGIWISLWVAKLGRGCVARRILRAAVIAGLDTAICPWLVSSQIVPNRPRNP